VTGRALGWTVAVLCAVAAVVTISGARRSDVGRSQEFQRLVGGLGLGPSTDLSRSGPDFDARLGEVRDEFVEPIPGGEGR
jgi:hypothetical protein